MFQIARGSGAILSECPFSSKKRTSPKDFLNADHFKTLRQKEPGTSHFDEQSEQLQDKILQLLVPNSKMLGGYNQIDVLFL